MWIQHNPEYCGLLPASSSSQTENLKFGSSFMSTELHEETTKLYISAARQRQSDAIDPDIQVGAVSWQVVMTVSIKDIMQWYR